MQRPGSQPLVPNPGSRPGKYGLVSPSHLDLFCWKTEMATVLPPGVILKHFFKTPHVILGAP